MINNLHDIFTKTLKAVVWEKPVQEEIGIRFVQIDGKMLRNSVIQNTLKEFLNEIFTQLPKDITLVPFADGSYFIQGISSGAYTDNLVVSVGSREWAKNEGGAIPTIVPTISKKLLNKNLV